MDAGELARSVAGELGASERDATEKVLQGEVDATRAFGISEAMAVGSCLAACAQLAVQVYQARQDRLLLVQALLDKAPSYPNLDPERRLGLMARLINRLVPERYGASPSLGKLVERTKQQWIAEWLSQQKAPASTDGSTTRDFRSATILYAFADMEHYCVWRPIYWTPPQSAPRGLPASVAVPAGFVTNLASIPRAFWWAVPPAGRHGHAAILHDWLYWEQSTSREVADRVFDAAMDELIVSPPVRTAMWAAVRVFGGPYWTDGSEEKRSGKGRVLTRLPDRPNVTWEEWRRQPDVFN